MHLVAARRERLGDRDDQDVLMAGINSSCPERDVRAACRGQLDAGKVRLDPSLKSRRISFAEETVPPTAGVAFSSWAWAKAVMAAQARTSEAAILRSEALFIIWLL